MTDIVIWRAAKVFPTAHTLKQAIAEDTHHTTYIRKLEGSKYVPNQEDLIINWGNAGFKSFPELVNLPVDILNKPSAVMLASNKYLTLRGLTHQGISCLDYTDEIKVVEDWLEEGWTVIGRQTLHGSGGDGIVIISDEVGLVEWKDLPLYTKYQKKKWEYRVHVFKGSVIDITQKKKKLGTVSPTNGKIRNLAEGWIFAHNDIKCNDVVALRTLAIEAVNALGLDFGGVDIIYNEAQDKYYIVEINTAPGLENTETIKAYRDAFIKEANNV